MPFTIQHEENETTIELRGDISGLLINPQERAQLDPLFQPGRQIVIDVSQVEGLTALGLRAVLLLYRQASSISSVSIVGASQEILDFVEATGFLQKFGAPAKEAFALPSFQIPRIDIYPTHSGSGFALCQGRPLPLGASTVSGGVNFSVFSQHGQSCTLTLFIRGHDEPSFEIPFPEEFRIGHVFSMVVFGLVLDRFEYGFRVDGPLDPRRGHRFDSTRVLLDPYAHSIVGREVWRQPMPHSENYPFRSCLVTQDFDWEGDRTLGTPIENLIIYEMHVRGFTASSSSGVKFPGTYAGLREKIPYLKTLGINCVELMPIFEFDECEIDRRNPHTGEELVNYWGYSTVGFWAPKAGYAATGSIGLQVDEFKALVKELHANGIEVILDVVFNHTAEGDERGPTLSFRGLDNSVYYLLTPDGHYHNFSGCGNTLNCNHPVVRELVLSCLRHWVADYHIDGFRFDLASILGRDQEGHPLPNPPLLEALAADPVLGNTKLIAEAWDAGGLYQVGSFPDYGRWAEWNGHFRDIVRRFLKGDAGYTGEMASCLMGSPHLYNERGPKASINFITCHDGFTLWDLVSYNNKHNEANGEDNQDGENQNSSWNCGVEGPTDDPQINALRHRQIKNALAILLISRGVVMLLMGDECGRTQEGNNNAYCQDGPLTWLDWNLLERENELFRFAQLMIRFRHEHEMLRYAHHPGSGGVVSLSGEDFLVEVTWHGTLPDKPDFSTSSRVLAFMVSRSAGAGEDITAIYVAMNMYWEPLVFALPGPPQGQRWHLSINTSNTAPEDIWESGQEPLVHEQGRIQVGGRSIIVLLARV